MRSRFDAYLTRLEMGGYIVTEDFIYPLDRHGREYGWGWSLLTTPERLFGRKACHPDRSPQESRERMLTQFQKILPHESEKTYAALLKLVYRNIVSNGMLSTESKVVRKVPSAMMISPF